MMQGGAEYKDSYNYAAGAPTVVVAPPPSYDGGYSRPPPPPPAPLAQQSSGFTTALCTCSCFRVFSSWMLLYLALIVASSLFTVYVNPVLGLVLLAILPATTILTFLESVFRKSVIRMQMVFTFFEAVCWMIPIVIVENIVQYLLINKTGLPKEGICNLCILSDFLQSFLVAGLFEESVKYLAVRRIVFKDFVVDPRALVVYSCCAGAAFGTVEDLMYVFNFGLGTAVVRAFVSVPLHCGTGLIIGVSLADRRFFQKDTERWYKTLILPILVHGTFDFLQFMLESTQWAFMGFVASFAILIATYLYVRSRLLVLLKAFPHEVDVHEKLRNGEIVAPGIKACCTPNCCPSCYL